MSTPQYDDNRLTELLQESHVYIEDNGFTERVMDRLPPPHRASHWRRPILLFAALVACLVGLVLIPGGAYLTDALYQVVTYRPLQSPLPLPLIPMAILLVVVGGTIAAAVHD
jgi:Domain of unknown function (DUF5056)